MSKLATLDKLIPGLHTSDFSEEHKEKLREIVKYSIEIIKVFPAEMEVDGAIVATIEAATKLTTVGISNKKNIQPNEVDILESLDVLIELIQEIKKEEIQRRSK